MKQSFYTFVLTDNDSAFWYNALSHKHFRISTNLSDKLNRVLQAPDILKSLHPELYDKLIDSGFIVEDGVNEIDIIRQKHKQAVNRKNYFLVVLPTLNCNFKCWYCIQEHVPSKMSLETITALKNHIEYMITEEKIELLHLDWFGGEPFLYFNEIIKPITEFAIAQCKLHSIPFIASSTTNAYFINESVSYQLADLHFRHFQITLDGNKEMHDKVKYMNGCVSAFETALRNINNILLHSPQSNIYLRINYTHDNLTEAIIDQVNELISTEFRSRITIGPHKVWQVEADKSYNDPIIQILNNFEKSGYNVARQNINLNYTPCYVNEKYYNSINYNGDVLKCTANSNLHTPLNKGKITSDGRIIWKDK